MCHTLGNIIYVSYSWYYSMCHTLGIISCVYKKMLSVSTVELSHFTTGETVNFMSTDVDRVSVIHSNIYIE